MVYFFISLLFLHFHHTNPFLIPYILKNSSYHKLLKLCITEALLSVGFQKANTSALQCFTDIIMQRFQGYDIDSLVNFMDQNYIEKGESVLHKMNVLPRNLVYKARGGGIFTDNYDEEVHEDADKDVVEFADYEEDVQKGNEEDVQEKIERNTEENEKDFEEDLEKNCKQNAEQNYKNNAEQNYKNNAKNNAEEIVSVIDEIIYEPWISEEDYLVMLRKRNVRDYHCYEGGFLCQLLDDLRVFYTREVDKSSDD